jgi:CubicO group peptidase (beta-lactamase class C family)
MIAAASLRPRVLMLLAVLGSLCPVAEARSAPASASSAAVREPAPGRPASLGAALDDFFRREESYGFSGAVLVAQRGRILLARGYGEADRRRGVPATAETVFDVGSITKQFTAAAILRLEMDGRLSTQDTLGKYLPRIAARLGVDAGPRAPGAPDLGAITLHQLLSHTSGLADLYLDQAGSWKSYLERILREPLTAPPGARYAYTNTGYDLLAAVVELASGEGYESYLRRHLFLPAGMRQTGFALPRWRRGRLARYQDWETREWRFPVELPIERPPILGLTGSGGMLSTVGDLYRWHLALLGDRLLSPAAKARLYGVVQEDYAYGWRVAATSRGTRVVFHGGYDTSLAMCAGFYRFLDEDTVFVVLANTIMNRSLSHEYLAAWVEHILFGGPLTLPPPAARLAARDLAGLGGRYRLAGGGVLEVAATAAGRLVVSTEDAAAVLLLTFPDAPGEGAGAWGGDERIASLLARIDQGDFAALHGLLRPGQDEAAAARQMSSWWAAAKEHLGNFLGSRTVYQMWFDFAGAPEVQLYELLRFARGAQVVRALRDLDGKLQFSPFRLPERIELTLAAPAGSQGGDLFSAWNPKLQMGPRLRFHRAGVAGGAGEAATLEVLGRHVQTVAQRVADPAPAAQGGPSPAPGNR